LLAIQFTNIRFVDNVAGADIPVVTNFDWFSLRFFELILVSVSFLSTNIAAIATMITIRIAIPIASLSFLGCFGLEVVGVVIKIL